MRQLIAVIGIAFLVLRADLSRALEIPSPADFNGYTNIHSIGRVKAKLHIRPELGNPDINFAVLAFADNTGDFTVGRIYRFNHVSLNPVNGKLHMQLEVPTGVGFGRMMVMFEAEFNGNDLHGVFSTNQVAPDGGLVEGAVELQKSLVTSSEVS